MRERQPIKNTDKVSGVLACAALALSGCLAPAPRELKLVGCVGGARQGQITMPLAEGEAVRLGESFDDVVFARSGEDLVVTQADELKAIGKNQVVVVEPSTIVTATLSGDREFSVKVVCR